ncbi:MAG: ACP synthase, partial [Verrucomicrobia bacterium]|nr:ACP synthase [Verrucomicrobiota bacterium]
MIVGIGTDIVEVERIRSLLEKNGETFLNKILR